MRLLFALIYMAVGMWIYLRFGGDNLHPYIGMAVAFGLMFSSVIVCNEGFLRRLKSKTEKQYIDELIRNKKAVKETYHATDAVTFDDLSTSSMCHIIDIGNERLLCLYGQYLYDYVEIDDDPELLQSRSFPTSSFSLVRKVKNGEIMQLNKGNSVIDEVRYKNAKVENLGPLGFKLEDGEIVSGVSLAEVGHALNG